MTSFFEQVMLRKEATERVRVRNTREDRPAKAKVALSRGRVSTRRARSAASPGGGQT